jgi:hypothetical protein
MEIKQHRLAVRGKQDVRRFDVHVQQAALMSVLQAIRQTRTDRADRLNVRAPGNEVSQRFCGLRRDRQLNVLNAALNEPSSWKNHCLMNASSASSCSSRRPRSASSLSGSEGSLVLR